MASTPDKKAAPRSNIGKRRLAAKSEGSEYYLERREALKKAAATLFKQHALNDVSLDDIARLAGVERSSIYYYVSGKKELFFEVVREVMAAIIKRVETIRKGPGTPERKLELLVVALMENYAANYPYMYLYLREHLTEADTRKTPQLRDLTALAKQVDEIVVDIVRAGISSESLRSDLSVRVISYGLLGMVNWTHRWFKPSGKLSGEEVGREFAEIMLNGVKRRDGVVIGAAMAGTVERVEGLIAEGATLEAACREVGISEVGYRSLSDEIVSGRTKENENTQLRRLVSDLSLEVQSLKDRLITRSMDG